MRGFRSCPNPDRLIAAKLCAPPRTMGDPGHSGADRRAGQARPWRRSPAAGVGAQGRNALGRNPARAGGCRRAAWRARAGREPDAGGGQAGPWGLLGEAAAPVLRSGAARWPVCCSRCPRLRRPACWTAPALRHHAIGLVGLAGRALSCEVAAGGQAAPGGQEGAGRAGGAHASGSRVPSTAASATSVRRRLLLRA